MSLEELNHEKYHDYQDYVIARRDIQEQQKNKPAGNAKVNTNIKTGKKILVRSILFLLACSYILIWIIKGYNTILNQIIVQILLVNTIEDRKKLTISDILTIIEITGMLGITLILILISLIV